MSEIELLRQSLDVLTADLALCREQAEQWRGVYLNEVNRSERLLSQVLLLTTPMQKAPVSTVESDTEEDDHAMPQSIVQAIGHRSFDENTRRELVQWAETQRANGMDADSIANTILIGAMRSEDTDEFGFEGPDEPAEVAA